MDGLYLILGQVHEDNDILGRFSPEEYTWVSPAKGLFQIGCFVTTVFGLLGVVYMFYPDMPAVPRTFPHNGLEKALGGPGVLKVRYSRECQFGSADDVLTAFHTGAILRRRVNQNLKMKRFCKRVLIRSRREDIRCTYSTSFIKRSEESISLRRRRFTPPLCACKVMNVISSILSTL
jgi:hypothetical protein